MAEFATFGTDDNNDVTLRQEVKSGAVGAASGSRSSVYRNGSKDKVGQALTPRPR